MLAAEGRTPRPGKRDAGLEVAIGRWSRDVATPCDVLRAVAALRADLPGPPSPRREQVLHQVELLGVTAVAQRQVREALTDPLTGLASRARLEDEVQHLIAVSTRHDSPLTAVMLDVDGLKQINDELGHSAGDAAIAEVGRAITTHLRKADRAFRWGGDEFMLFLPDTTAQAARLVVERIQSTCATPTSYGVASHSGFAADIDVESWLSRADTELYSQKARTHAVVHGRLVARSGRTVTPVRRVLEAAALGLVSAAAASVGWLVVSTVADNAGIGGSHDKGTSAAPATSGALGSGHVITPDVVAPTVSAVTAPVRHVTKTVTTRRSVVTPAVARVVVPTTTLPDVTQPPTIPVVIPDQPAPTQASSGFLSGLVSAVGNVLRGISL
ncbi:MAG: GGDEF domain-containing protein [Actinomycetota bacterium]|nr:GGDEF domain-containing protein [Actinomycetota bacterium]